MFILRWWVFWVHFWRPFFGGICCSYRWKRKKTYRKLGEKLGGNFGESGVASANQTKERAKTKVHEFRPFSCELWWFFLRKTSTIHELNFCSGMHAPAKSSWTDLSLIWFAGVKTFRFSVRFLVRCSVRFSVRFSVSNFCLEIGKQKKTRAESVLSEIA